MRQIGAMISILDPDDLVKQTLYAVLFHGQ
jgi:hypothetical protein